MMLIPIIFEDDELLIIDKPAGLIVHEGAGHSNDSESSVLLTNWLKAERPAIVASFAAEIDQYFRPGIVHRLDKDTSGLLVIAKTPAIKSSLQALFKQRTVTKEYTTLVVGRPEPEQGSIETYISRNPRHRRQMAVSFTEKGKPAKTAYRLTRTWQYRYKGQAIAISLVEVTLHSGRMHQIRVHMKYKGWPIIGDQTYRTKPSHNIAKEFQLERQFLHARRLSFAHPTSQQPIDVLSPLPADLQRIIDQLEEQAV